jgi:parallel beta helix pectate lyase-like protein
MRAFPLVLILVVLLGASPAWAVKAFPTAEGFGAAETVGGRGGVVMEVKNLNDSGADSLRACVQATGPRICVFRVGGVIELQSPLGIYAANAFLTIAGQTAPGEGITLKYWPVAIAYGAHDVIIRHLRHRQAYDTIPADGNNACGAFFVYGPFIPENGRSMHTYNVILDHVSAGYACDDSTSATGYVTGITYQWSLIGEGYECRPNVSGVCQVDPYGGSKGYIGQANQPESPLATMSFHHNMIINSVSRNPAVSPFGLFDFRYNLVYNWNACDGNVSFGGADNNIPTSLPDNVNFVGNTYIAGPDTPADFSGAGCKLGTIYSYSPAHIYAQDNETPYCGGNACAANEWALGWHHLPSHAYPPDPAQFRVTTPHTAPSITATPRAQMETTLKAKVGATVPKRDALDTRLVSELTARTGNYGRRGEPFPTLANCNGISTTPPCTAAPVDTDHDGMPDAWEDAHGLNKNSPADGPATATNGYTNLENYLNELAGDDTGGGPTLTPTAIYLSAGGHGDTPSDSGDCTVPENKDTPRATLAAALACMQVPGKVLYIRGGTYAGVINTHGGAILGGTAADKPTRIEGYQAEGVTLQLPVGGVNALEINGISNFTVDKLTVDAMARADSNALVCKDSNNITIRNSHFRNAFFEVGYFNNCSTVEVTKSQFHDSMNAPVISLVGTNTSVKFDELEVYNGPLQGIDAPTSATNNSLTISRTQIRGTGTGAGGPALNLGGGSGALIVNNIIDHNNAGVRIRATASGAKIYHNAVAANRGVGIQCDSGATSITISNNISFSNGTDSVVNNCSAMLVDLAR